MRLSATRTSPQTSCVLRTRFLKAAAAGLVGIACTRLGPSTAPPAGSRAVPIAVDTMTLRAVAAFLAHDDLRGRGTGTAGGRIAAACLAAECRRLGFQPAGDTYFQELPIGEATIVPDGT